MKQQKQNKNYSFSFIPPGLLLPSLSIRWDSISFLSLALSVNRSHSPFTRMLWMECPAWLEWLATGLSLWRFMSARCSFSRFADVAFDAFGAMNNVHDVVRLADELFGDVHLGFRSLDADVGADEGARFAFLVVARSGSWCSGGWLP